LQESLRPHQQVSLRSLELRKTAVHRLASFRQQEVGDQFLLVDRVKSGVDLRVHRLHAAAGGQDAQCLVAGGGGDPSHARAHKSY